MLYPARLLLKAHLLTAPDGLRKILLDPLSFAHVLINNVHPQLSKLLTHLGINMLFIISLNIETIGNLARREKGYGEGW